MLSCAFLLFSFLAARAAGEAVALPCQAVGGRKTVVTTLDSRFVRVSWVDTRIALVETEFFDLWRTRDGGAVWDSQLDKLQNSRQNVNGTAGRFGVRALIRTARPLTILFDGFGNHLWRTDDGGETYAYIPTPPNMALTDFAPHPTQAGTLLARWTDASGVDNLVVSDNAGNSWRPVTPYLYYNRFAWGHNALNVSEPAIWLMQWPLVQPASGGDGVAVRSRNKYDVQLVSSADEFKSEPTLEREHVADFLVSWTDRFLLLAEYTDASARNVSLVASPDVGATFVRAQFPRSLDGQFFTFLEHADSRVFMHVRRSFFDTFGNLFGSDARGLSFSLSLAQVSTENGVVEFRPMRGMPGVYFANQKRVRDDVWDARVITMMSTDNGGSWQPIAATGARVVDERGKPIDCTHAVAPDGLAGCYLSFSVLGKSPSRAQLQQGSFHSTAKAPGVALAVGNVGPWYDRAQDDSDAHATFLTRDAGATWQRVRNGSHIGEIADQGNVIVLVRDSRETNTLIWSVDAGASWRECLFAATPVFVSNIVSEPSTSGTDVIIFGTQLQANRRVAVVVYVELAEFERRCAAADYEEWRPNGDNCDLGERVVYQRRKPLAQCHADDVPPPNRTACACELADYECDFCYERRDSGSAGSTGLCQRVYGTQCPDVIPLPEFCPATRSKGYRRIAGNNCSPANVNYEPEALPCTPAHKSPSVAYMALIVSAGVVGVLAICTCVCVAQYRRNQKFNRWVRSLNVPGLRSRASQPLAASAFGEEATNDDDLLDDKGGY